MAEQRHFTYNMLLTFFLDSFPGFLNFEMRTHFKILLLMVHLLRLSLKRKILGKHTGESPETYLSTAWNVFAVTSPLIVYLKNSFYYANTE